MIRKLKRKILYNLKDIFWGFKGRGIQNPELPEKVESIMFVCMGNICRSPFAEKLMKKILEERGMEAIRVSSSGLIVKEPTPSPGGAIEAGKSFGVDLTGHISTQLTSEMVDNSDMILAMEPWQWEELKELYPDKTNKIFLLSLFEDSNGGNINPYLKYNITDPYGRGVSQFVACYNRIENCLIGILSNISDDK
jgi:protein-tyrosine-phosphatase